MSERDQQRLIRETETAEGKSAGMRRLMSRCRRALAAPVVLPDWTRRWRVPHAGAGRCTLEQQQRSTLEMRTDVINVSGASLFLHS